MNPLLQLLSGKKTYLTTLAIGVLLFGSWQHWWQIPDQIYVGLMAAAVAFLRAGIAKGPDAPAASGTAPAGVATSSMKLPLMLVFASIAMMAIIGCNTTPQRVAYEAAGTTTVSVDTAMNLWGRYVAAKHPPAVVELKVKAAYQKYQASMAIACDAGAAYASTSVTNSVASSAASLALQQAISNANTDLMDLELLITSYGVPLK